VGALIAWGFAGQGSQRKGMGAAVLDRFADRCAAADAILGYSIRALCLENPDGRLRQTRYAQPAIYVVGALSFLAMTEPAPDFVAGHSVGEYAALLVAGCYDFETGLRLVQQRAELMSRVEGGGMVAVIGLGAERVTEVLAAHGLADLDVANYNLRQQLVISGPRASLPAATQALEYAGGRCVALDVSAAFHSRYMAEAAADFGDFVRSFRFEAPRVPVLSNVTAAPYAPGTVAELLARQITAPVRWHDSMQYLLQRGVGELREIGATRVLRELWRVAREEAPAPPAPSAPATVTRTDGAQLGSAAFCRDHGLRYAYLAGSMFRGVASVALVVRMANAGLMGFLGTGGLTLDEIDAALHALRRELGAAGRYGANLLHQIDAPEVERALVALYLRHDVRCIEAAAYMQITPALVHYRFQGAHLAPDGRPTAPRRIVAKVSRPEVAAAFMQPAPDALVRRLVEEGALTPDQAEVARRLPVSQDVCVESDSAGHTDGGVALALVPVMTRLRDDMMERYRYPDRIRIGASGGLGAPEAVAAAFVLGADFIVTGSVNQCSPEAGTSAPVKELLATLDVQDTGYAPAGDMFELGARVQVMRKGTLFAARANNLYQLYRQHASLEAIDSRTRSAIEGTWFRRSFDEVWRDTRDYHARTGRPGELERAARDPKHRMALVFRWYFARSIRLALDGDLTERVNFQVHCGPAMGAFNRFVHGTDLQEWRNRHVDIIADRLMHGAAQVLRRSTATV
jgi:trans-AT polyketide synthase/acyltransferase/oxidoreductase domain-containing protein